MARMKLGCTRPRTCDLPIAARFDRRGLPEGQIRRSHLRWRSVRQRHQRRGVLCAVQVRIRRANDQGRDPLRQGPMCDDPERRGDLLRGRRGRGHQAVRRHVRCQGGCEYASLGPVRAHLRRVVEASAQEDVMRTRRAAAAPFPAAPRRPAPRRRARHRRLGRHSRGRAPSPSRCRPRRSCCAGSTRSWWRSIPPTPPATIRVRRRRWPAICWRRDSRPATCRSWRPRRARATSSPACAAAARRSRCCCSRTSTSWRRGARTGRSIPSRSSSATATSTGAARATTRPWPRSSSRT